jgi:pilus assembly protein Flp/PilA
LSENAFRIQAKADRSTLQLVQAGAVNDTASIDRSCRRRGSHQGELKMSTLFRFLRDDSGATAIEYGLIAAGISVAIIAVVQGLGSNLNTTFTSVQTALK